MSRRAAQATSRRAIRRLYQYRRYYWIAAVLGMVSIVIWQAPTKETTPAYVKQTEPIAVNCVAVSRPRTGIYRNYDLSANLAAPFEIRTAVGANYFVKLEDSVTREPVQTFFIRGGQTMQSDVPFGQFALKYATGRSWCGEIDMFGPETDFHKADVVLRFARQDSDDGYTITGHTIELVLQVNGNLKTSKIRRERFDAGHPLFRLWSNLCNFLPSNTLSLQSWYGKTEPLGLAPNGSCLSGSRRASSSASASWRKIEAGYV